MKVKQLKFSDLVLENSINKRLKRAHRKAIRVEYDRNGEKKFSDVDTIPKKTRDNLYKYQDQRSEEFKKKDLKDAYKKGKKDPVELKKL